MVQKTLVFLSEGHLHDFAQGSFGTEELAGGKYCATTTHRAEGFGTEPPKWVTFIYFQGPTVDLPEGNSTVWKFQVNFNRLAVSSPSRVNHLRASPRENLLGGLCGNISGNPGGFTMFYPSLSRDSWQFPPNSGIQEGKQQGGRLVTYEYSNSWYIVSPFSGDKPSFHHACVK